MALDNRLFITVTSLTRSVSPTAVDLDIDLKMYAVCALYEGKIHNNVNYKLAGKKKAGLHFPASAVAPSRGREIQIVAVNNVSFLINRRETFGLVGEIGFGKVHSRPRGNRHCGPCRRRCLGQWRQYSSCPRFDRAQTNTPAHSDDFPRSIFEPQSALACEGHYRRTAEGRSDPAESDAGTLRRCGRAA